MCTIIIFYVYTCIYICMHTRNLLTLLYSYLELFKMYYNKYFIQIFTILIKKTSKL